MPLPAATKVRPTTPPRHLRGLPSQPVRKGSDGPIGPVPVRNFEIAALRQDGSVYIGQHKAPAIALFEHAFSAFARGTLITTPTGQMPIEDLQPGDLITTASGVAVRLVWIGSSSFVPADAGRRVALTRIMADSFGHGRPAGFVTVGPAARILHRPPHLRAELGEKQLLTPVRDLIDGVNVIEVVPPTPVRLFHICLEQHATIVAGGLDMESFHPGMAPPAAVSASLQGKFLNMFPHVNDLADFGPLAHARASDSGVLERADA